MGVSLPNPTPRSRVGGGEWVVGGWYRGGRGSWLGSKVPLAGSWCAGRVGGGRVALPWPLGSLRVHSFPSRMEKTGGERCTSTSCRLEGLLPLGSQTPTKSPRSSTVSLAARAERTAKRLFSLAS